MTTLTPASSITPLELAINAIELQTEKVQDLVRYGDHLQHAKELAPKNSPFNIRVYVDHTLSLLVKAGYLHRHHMGPGDLAYSPTDSWSQRDELLSTLRSPKPIVRAWRTRAATKRREEKAKQKAEREEARVKARQEARAQRYAQKVAERGLTKTGKLRRRTAAPRHQAMAVAS